MRNIFRVWTVTGSLPTPSGGRVELTATAFGPDLAAAQANFLRYQAKARLDLDRLAGPPWDLADLVFTPVTPDPALTPPPVGGSLPSA